MEISVFTFYFLFIIMTLSMGFSIFLFIHQFLKERKDTVIIIDESNRWFIAKQDLKDKTKFVYKEKAYFLREDASVLNNKGRALWIFSKNKPSPMKICYNEAKWLSSEALMGAINNELIKMMVQPRNTGKDILLLVGALGGVIAGISSVLILLKQFGVL